MSRLTLAFLGPPKVQHGDRSLSFRTRKTLALLVYLAVEGGMQPRARLATLFWPESERQAGRASLRTTLALLRKDLDHPETAATAPHLRVERHAIGFNPDADYLLDLEMIEGALGGRAEQMQAAIDQIRGGFLEGFTLPDTPQFDEWVTFQQEQWHLRCSQLCQRLARRRLEGGQPSAAVSAANRWLALNPLEERAYRCLMEAHATMGDRPGALQLYEKCRSLLAEELGVEPAPETVALAERIRVMEEGGIETEVGEETAVPSRKPQPFYLPLVGRAEEHEQLVSAYHQARRGRFRLVTIEGEAGVGKTSLARHFLNWAGAQGATILPGRAFETGGRLPYQPIVDALRPIVNAEVELAPIWLAELSRLLPALRQRHRDLPSPTGDESTAQTRLFEAVARLGTSLDAQPPLLLFIDDVQWAGVATLDLLQYVAHYWAEARTPIMLLLGVRSEALARAGRDRSVTPLRDWLASLERDLAPVRLRLTSLDEADVEDLVGALGIAAPHAAPLARWLYRETEGQPFYLAETVEALVGEGLLVRAGEDAGRVQLALAPGAKESFPPAPGFMPPGVRQALARRLSRLSSTSFRMLAAAAVLGQAFDYRELCRVAGVDPEEGLTALDALLAAHLLEEMEEKGRPYLFAHDKIRDVAYTEAGDARRGLYHERAYAMLAERGAPAARLGHHALAAGLAQPAFHHIVVAGDEAMDLFAVRDGVDHYEQARALLQEKASLKETVDTDQIHHLYYQLGRGYELLDEWETARQVEKEMLALAREMEAPAMEVAALNRVAAVAIQSKADVETAADLLATAVEVAERYGDEAGLAETEWNLAQTCYHRRDRAGAIRHGQRALELATSLDNPQLMARSHNILSYAKNGPAAPSVLEEAEAHAAAARDLYQRLGDRAMAVDCMNMLGSVALHSGRPAEAVDLLRQARQVSREIENVWGQANTGFNLAQALLECGRYGKALTTAQESHEAAQSIGAWLTVATLTVRGNVYRALGALSKALADHQEVDATFASVSNPHVTYMMSGNLCVDHALAGDWEQAHGHARRALEHDRSDAWLFSAFHEWYLIEALLRGGDEEMARRATQQFGDLVGDNARYQIPYRRSQAALAEHDGHLEEAAMHLREALIRAETIGLPGEQWPLLFALAGLAEEQGDRETAGALRQRAHDVVQAITESIADPELRERFVDSVRRA